MAEAVNNFDYVAKEYKKIHIKKALTDWLIGLLRLLDAIFLSK